MTIQSPSTTVKVIGSNGQISLGKQFASRQVLVKEQEPGVWLIGTATVVPDNERWLHTPKATTDLQRALIWSQAHSPEDSGTERFLENLDAKP